MTLTLSGLVVLIVIAAICGAVGRPRGRRQGGLVASSRSVSSARCSGHGCRQLVFLSPSCFVMAVISDRLVDCWCCALVALLPMSGRNGQGRRALFARCNSLVSGGATVAASCVTPVRISPQSVDFALMVWPVARLSRLLHPGRRRATSQAEWRRYECATGFCSDGGNWFVCRAPFLDFELRMIVRNRVKHLKSAEHS
jgi:hypothetical protein